ncbi:hypothetical protein EDB89DRAFT_1972326 [Lactarius sanguifluus]|nr:hypothetical protein EDB89DRAFT_1972326 [Lactarius sanguifluus]
MGTQSHCPVSLPCFSELLLTIGSPSVHPLSLPDGPSSGATSHIGFGNIAQGHHKKQQNVCAHGESYRHETTIDMLPDDVLLDIFDLCQENSQYIAVWKWHLLVHVCRRWRQIVLESPRRLNLRILCTYGTPVRKNLGIWPILPIVIDYRSSGNGITPNDEDNVIAALEHPDRVCRLGLDVTGSQLEKMATVMQWPFPVLTRLEISLDDDDGNTPVLPSGFLGGAAPRLRTIYLHGTPFPALQTLLLSTNDLVELDLHEIPPTGYISPEAMVACLAALPRLDTFHIGFRSTTSRPDRLHPPPAIRTVLPALTSFHVQGASEYVEDLVSQINGPKLDRISIVYLPVIWLVDFQVAQLSNFIDRSVCAKLPPFGHVEVTLFSDWVTCDMYHADLQVWDCPPVRIVLLSDGTDWQVSHTAQLLSQLSATLSNVVHLKLKAGRDNHQLKDSDDVEWLLLLQEFSNVRTLQVSRILAGRFALALEDITEDMVAEVLPSLDSIRVVGQPASSIEKFLAIRQRSGRPVTVVDNETEFDI